MTSYRVRSKFVFYDLYLPAKSNGTVVLYVPGFPSHPRKRTLGEKLAKSGYTFLEMRYQGSWESEGRFTFNNCLTSLNEAYNFAQKSIAKELRFGKNLKWKHKKIVLLPGSFGGTVALSTNIKEPLTMVLLAPLMDTSDLSPTLKKVGNTDDLYNLVSKGYGMVYRGLTVTDWKKFITGKTKLNPKKNISNLRNKTITILQGSKDRTVTPESTRKATKWLQGNGVKGISYHLVANAGHGSDLEDKSFNLILKAIK